MSTRPAVRRGCALTRSDSRRSQAVPWCFIRTTAKAQARIQATGRGCRVEWYRDGDPADELKRWLMERSAIREFDGGATREDADRGAWRDVLSEVSNDGR